jgi:glutathione S-transferase
MKLYYSPGACSLAPHIVLFEGGFAFETEKVDIPNKKTASGADYWQINPKGYVPALQLDNGEVLTEVAVILQYLADRKPASGLAPAAGTMARYRLMEWLNFIATEVHKSVGALFNPQMTAEMKEVQKAYIARRFKALDAMMAGKTWLTGDAFSVADAYLFNVLRWCGYHKIDLAQWPGIQAFVARTAERPQVQAAMRAEGLIKS